MSNKPKILVLDIETAPILAHVWGLWDQNVSLNMIKSDWHILAFAAKWYGESASKIIYMDQRNAKNIEDDSALLKKVWELMNEADILLTQNGDAFDIKKLNARFILNGFKPPSSYKSIDTCKIAKRKFGFTSNKLEYMTHKLNKKYKKQKHAKFSGFELWTECLAGNLKAWNEMKVYNQYDVLALEELYRKLQPWDNSLNLNLYTDEASAMCSCGSTNFSKNGYFYTSLGKYQRYLCKDCGSEAKDRDNLFSKEKKKSLRSRA